MKRSASETAWTRYRRPVAPLTLLFSAVLLAFGAVTPVESHGAQGRYATTSKSATRVKPSPSRSQYSSRLSSRRAAQNNALRTSRSSAGRSALGDGRRNGVRLNSSPVSGQTAGQATRDTRRDGVQLSGTPATSWNSWNRDRAQGLCIATGIGAVGDAEMDGRADELIKRLTGLEVEKEHVEVDIQVERCGHQLPGAPGALYYVIIDRLYRHSRKKLVRVAGTEPSVVSRGRISPGFFTWLVQRAH